MSWKPEVFVEGKWANNGVAFATEAEALRSANDLMMRWLPCMGARAVESDEEPNYRIDADGLVRSIDGDQVVRMVT
jgi:hypothetical protein